MGKKYLVDFFFFTFFLNVLYILVFQVCLFVFSLQVTKFFISVYLFDLSSGNSEASFVDKQVLQIPPDLILPEELVNVQCIS